MGRIKTKQVKRVSRNLISLYGDKFGKEFSKNKQEVNKVAEFHSKKLRNIVAGYITRLYKKKEE